MNACPRPAADVGPAGDEASQSNQVEWPRYSNVTPMSRLVTNHVDGGRKALNFSEFSINPGRRADEIQAAADAARYRRPRDLSTGAG
jgi:hypothetical protein